MIRPGNNTSQVVTWLASGQPWRIAPSELDIIETHMSWIFIVDQNVFKLKKSIKTSVLDFSTVHAREHDCREEIRLNRRLAPGVYKGIVSVTQSTDGHLSLHGPGNTIDWLVVMRRLPATRMLDNMIRHNQVSASDVEALAAVLGNFYGSLLPIDVTETERLHRLEVDLEANRAVLEHPVVSAHATGWSEVIHSLERVITNNPKWLVQRQATTAMVEGHGDLRLQHICLLDPPVIYDCLEFNRDLRIVDPFYELAMLRMECTIQHAGWIGDHVIAHCSQVMKDYPSKSVMAFHTARSACLRGQLALNHLLDSAKPEPEHWVSMAADYLVQARAACREFSALGEGAIDSALSDEIGTGS